MMDVPIPPDLDGWKARQAEFDGSMSTALDSADKMVMGCPSFSYLITTRSQAENDAQAEMNAMERARTEVQKLLGKPWLFRDGDFKQP